MRYSQPSPLPSLLVNGLCEDRQCLSIARSDADILRDELLNPGHGAARQRASGGCDVVWGTAQHNVGTKQRPGGSEENMALRRAYRRSHPHPESAESRQKSNRKYRISSYGLTHEQFDRLLAAQQHPCGMCHERFEEGQLIHVDHDRGCCQTKNRSCGRCIRGLLCHTCNIALGYIERRYPLARAYLDSPPIWLVDAA